MQMCYEIYSLLYWSSRHDRWHIQSHKRHDRSVNVKKSGYTIYKIVIRSVENEFLIHMEKNIFHVILFHFVQYDWNGNKHFPMLLSICILVIGINICGCSSFAMSCCIFEGGIFLLLTLIFLLNCISLQSLFQSVQDLIYIFKYLLNTKCHFQCLNHSVCYCWRKKKITPTKQRKVNTTIWLETKGGSHPNYRNSQGMIYI